MELHAEDIAVLDDGAEFGAVIRFRNCAVNNRSTIRVRVIDEGPIGYILEEPRAGRVSTGSSRHVVISLRSGTIDHRGEEREAGYTVGFGAALEHPLHADADAEEERFVVDRVADCLAQSALVQWKVAPKWPTPGTTI